MKKILHSVLVKELDAGLRTSRPFRMDGGALGLCTAGEAEVVTDFGSHSVVKGCEIVLLDESSLFIKRTSTDFRMLIFIYSKEMAFQALHKFEAKFFTFIKASPIYNHNDNTEELIRSYMSILSSLQNDTHNRYNVIIATNLLRCMMLSIYDKIQWHSADKSTGTSRKQEKLDAFMDLVIRHSRKHREVKYYASRLCISVRYLSEITRGLMGESPKQIIDRQIISEVKLMLTFSSMSVQQMADYLHFPDQSYLGRFFKHHVGMSPLEYRKQEMVM